MQAFKTAILVTSLVALAGCASSDTSSIKSLDKSPICPKTHGWLPWPDARCDEANAPKDMADNTSMLANELDAARKQNRALSSRGSDLERRIAELESQLADRDKELSFMHSKLSDEMTKLKEAQRGLIRALRPQIEKGDITVDLNNERLLINLASSYLFDSGQDELKPAGADALKRVGAVLKDFPEYKVHVEGHTDNVPIQGALKKKFPSNQELSEGRATHAAKALADGGLENAHAMGAADTKPVEPNTTASGRAKNRRVEVRVTK